MDQPCCTFAHDQKYCFFHLKFAYVCPPSFFCYIFSIVLFHYYQRCQALFFFLLLSFIFICSFFSLLRLSCIAFFLFFSYFLICSFQLTLRPSRFSFSLLLFSIFKCSFSSSLRLSRINFVTFS